MGLREWWREIEIEAEEHTAAKAKADGIDRYLGEGKGALAPKARTEELNNPHLVARRAFEDGDRLIQFVLPIVETRRGWSRLSGWPDDVARSQSRHSNVIEAIEAEGWKLEHASYVFEQTGYLSRDQLLKSGQTARVTGQVLGIYIFRRDETSRERGNPPSNAVASVGTEEPRMLVASQPAVPGLRGVSRACPHCKKAIPRDASTCPHCQKESRAWVLSDGVWWLENERGWFWLDESSRTWIRAEGA